MSRFSTTERFAPPTNKDVPGPGEYNPLLPDAGASGGHFVKSGRFGEDLGNPELGPGKYFDKDGNVVASQHDIDMMSSHGTRIRAPSRSRLSSRGSSNRLTARSGSRPRVPTCAFPRGRTSSRAGAGAKEAASSTRSVRGATSRRSSSLPGGARKSTTRRSSKAPSKARQTPHEDPNQKSNSSSTDLESALARITDEARRAKDEYDAKVNEMENELKQGQEYLNAAEAEKRQLEQERDALRARLHDVESIRQQDTQVFEQKLQQAHADKKELQDRIAALDSSQQHQLAQFQAQLKEKKEEIVLHESKLLELQSMHSDEKAKLYSEAKELNKRIDQKANECDAVRQKYSALASEKAALEHRFKELESNVTSNHELQTSQRLKIQELEDSRDHLQREVRERANSSDILRTRVAELEKSLETEREKNTHHQHDFARITAVFNESQLKIKSQDEQTKKLAHSNQELQRALASLKQLHEGLRQTVSERDGALASLNAKHARETELTAEQVEEERSTLVKERDQLKQKSESLHERVIALLATQTDISNALKEVTSQRDECQAALEETRSLASHQQQTIKVMEAAAAEQLKNITSLKKELDASKSLLYEAQRRESQQEAERGKLAQEIESGKSLNSHLTERAEGLMGELNRLQSANSALEDERNELRNARESLQAHVVELQAENQTTHEKLVEERSKFNTQCQTLSQDIAQKTAEFQRASSQLKQIHGEFVKQQKQTELVKGELEKLQAVCATKTSEIASLKQTLKAREEHMKVNVEEANQRETRHKESAARLSHELTRLGKDHELLRRELSEKGESLNELAAVRETLETELHALSQRERETQLKLSKSAAELEQTRGQLADTTAARDSLQDDLTTLRGDHDKLLTTITELENQRSSLKTVRSENEQRIVALESELNRRSEVCAATEQRLRTVEEHAKNEMKRQQQSYASLNQKFVHLGNEYQSARRDASQWQSQYRALQKENEKSKLLRGKLHRAGHEMESQEMLLSQRSKKIEAYERELGIAKRRIRAQTEQISELETQKSRLSSENVSLKSANIDKETEIETMRRRERAASSSSVESSSSSSSAAHSKQLVLHSGDTPTSTAEMDSELLTKYDRAHANERKYRIRYEESQKALLQTQDKLDGLRSSYDQLLNGQNTRLSSGSQNETQSEISRLRSENARLQKKVSHRENEKAPSEQQAAETIARLRQQLQAQQSHADSLQVEVSSMEGKYVQIYGEHHRLKQRFASVAKLEKEVERLKEENAKLIGHTNRNQKISLLHEYRAEISKLKGELVDARTDNVKLKKRCHLLANRQHSSASTSSSTSSSSALTSSTLSSAARQRENSRSPRESFGASHAAGGALHKPKSGNVRGVPSAKAIRGQSETHKENVSPNGSQ